MPTSPPPGRDAIAPWIVVGAVWVSYRVAFLITVAFCALDAACFWLARPRPHHV